MRLTTRDVARIRELRYVDGLTRQRTADIVGCSAQTVGRYAPGSPGKIDNTLLREAFLASGLSAAEVARRIGWWFTATGRPARGDGARVKRSLGVLLTTSGAGRRCYSRLIDAETAAAIADAIGVAAWEITPDEAGRAA